MRILAVFTLFVLLVSTGAYAQSKAYTVRGTIKDTTGGALPGAFVKLVSGNDSLSAVASIDGSFNFNNVKFSAFTLKTGFLGFKNYARSFTYPSGKVLEIPVVLKENSNTLNEVVVSGVVPVRIKEDTIQYNAAAYKVREGDAVEEVIKKLPGLTVDKDGNVSTQGKPITKIRVNGKDFFGSDVATAIQNLPADIVQNLQVIDDYGDQAKLTGIKTGEPEKILNINIQPDKKKGYYVKATGGMGNQSRYVSSVRGNTFKGDQQIAFLGSMSNTNLRRNGDGITNYISTGINYQNDFNDKLSVDASYNYRNSDNETESNRHGETYYSADFTRIVVDSNTNNSKNNSHSLRSNIEYKMDSLNYFKVSPNFSFNGAETNSIGLNNTFIRKASSIRNSATSGNSLSLSAGTNLYYNHKFPKKGRNFSLWSVIDYSNGNNDRDTKNDYQNTDSLGQRSLLKQYQLSDNHNDNFRTAVNLSYLEPIGTHNYLELSYNWSKSNTRSNRDLSQLDTNAANPSFNDYVFNAAQSNNFKYQFITQRIGFNYRYIRDKFYYTLGVSAQPAKLEGTDISRNISTEKQTFNFIPTARFVYRFNKQKRLSAYYNGRSSQPGFTQLQPLTDSTNLQNIVIGNPDLKPEFTHGLNVDYNQSDWSTGYTFLGNVSFSRTENKIVTSRTFDPNRARQVTNYMNTDGFYTLRGNYSYSKPFADRKFTLTYRGEANYNNNIAFSEGIKNIGKNLVLEQGLRFRLDLEDIVDTEIRTDYSINTTRYSLESFSDRQTNRLVMGLNGRNYFFKDLTLGYDFSKTLNKGFVNSDNANPAILNLYMEYRFLKGNMGSITLHAFDLFDENTGISRDVFDNEIVDSRVNRLGRYFLCSFNLRLRKFG